MSSAEAGKSETVRRSGRRRERGFVAPRPDATLTHLVKILIKSYNYLLNPVPAG
jgi:hypothetical protein